jgi:prepilin peptidase CpaA
VIPLESEVNVPSANSLQSPAIWVLLALVLTAARFDLRFRRIPNWLTGAGIVLGIAASVFERGIWRGLRFSLAGLCLALAIYLVLYALHATGAGDGKLMAAIGAIAGWKHWLGIFIVTAILGGIAALALSISRRRLKKTLWNVGFVLSEMKRGRPAYLANEELDVRSSKGLRLPHGAVIAAATLAYLALGFYFGD